MSFDRIGLGTNNPQADFHLVGNSIIQGNVTIGLNSVATNPLRIASDGNVPTLYATHDGTNGIYAAKFEATTSVAQGIHIKTVANSSSINALLVEGTSSNVVVKSNGRLGIGTDTPDTTLHVIGGANITGAVSVGSIDIATLATSNLSSASINSTNITATAVSAGTIYASAISIPVFTVSTISASMVSAGTVHVGSTRLSSDKTSYTLIGTDAADEVLNTKIVMYGSDYAGVGGTIKLIATQGQGGDISFNYQPSSGTMITNMVIGSDGRTGIGTNVIASGVRLAIEGNVVISGATTISGATVLRDSLSVGGVINGSTLSLSSTIRATNISAAIISSANAFVGNITLTNGVAGTVSINTAIINTASIGTLTFNNVSVSGQVSASSITASSLSVNTGVVITEYISTAYIRTAEISNAVIVGVISSGNLIATAATLSNGQVIGKLSVGGAVNLGGNYFAGDIATIGYIGSNAFTRFRDTGLAITDSTLTASTVITHSSVSIIDHNAGGQLLLNTSGGNVGIGTTNAINKLHVNGTAKIDGLLSVSGIVVNGTISATTFVGAVQTTGAVIDGTLSVTGAVRMNTSLSVGGATALIGFVSTGSTLFVAGNMITNNNVSIAGRLSTALGINVAGGLYSTDYMTIGYSTATSFVRVSNGGKLAITDNPITSSLEFGHSSSSSIIDNNNNNPILLNSGYTGSVGVGATLAANGKFEVLDNQKTYGTFIDKYNAGYGLGVRMASSSASDYILYTTANGGSTNGLFVTCAGRVGVGTVSPAVPLHITGGVNIGMFQDPSGQPYSVKYSIMNNPSGTNSQTLWDATSGTVSSAVSIRTSNTIFSETGFAHLSDERIKKDIHMMNDEESLEMLRKIEPKKYKYIDLWERGSQDVIGFIAQDVQKNIPHATHVQSGFVPDIFTGVSCIKNKLLFSSSNLKPGDKLRAFLKGKEKIVNIEKVESDCVYIDEVIADQELEDGSIFLYGKEVNDLLSIKKDYLFTINFAATQELDRKVAKLEQENTDLKQKLAIIMEKLNM